MRKRTTLAATALLVGALAVLTIGSYATADSGTKNVEADTMIGYQETPAVSTGATGNFEAVIDDAANTIEYELSYSGLEGDIRQAHIHFGQRGITGGISVWLCQTTFNMPPAGPAAPACRQSGTVTGTLGPSNVIGPAGQGLAETGAIAVDEFDQLVPPSVRDGRTRTSTRPSSRPARYAGRSTTTTRRTTESDEAGRLGAVRASLHREITPSPRFGRSRPPLLLANTHRLRWLPHAESQEKGEIACVSAQA